MTDTRNKKKKILNGVPSSLIDFIIQLTNKKRFFLSPKWIIASPLPTPPPKPISQPVIIIFIPSN